MARQYQPPTQFIAPVGGSMEQRLQLIADELSRKANATTMPTYGAIGLVAPDGGVWLVTVDNAGVLSTSPVTP